MHRWISGLQYVVDQPFSCRPLTADARVRSQLSPCKMCGWPGGRGTGLLPSTTIHSCIGSLNKPNHHPTQKNKFWPNLYCIIKVLFANLMHNFFIKSIIFLYMFRALLCSSSGDLIAYIHHLVPDIVTLLRRPFGTQVSVPNGLLRRVTISGTRWCIYTIKSSWWWAQ